MTEEQKQARLKAGQAGRSAYRAKALKRAQDTLDAREKGATYTQLADALGISEGSVANYLSRARERVEAAKKGDLK